MHKNFSFYTHLQNLCSTSRFSLDHPGTRPLSAGPSLGPEHPGTRLATPRWRGANIFVWVLYLFFFFSMQYTSLQSKSYSNSRYFLSADKSLFNADPVPDQVLAMGSTATESLEEEARVFLAFRTWPTHQRPTQMG